LLPAGDEAVKDAARNDEVRTRIVVGQREPRAMYVNGGDETEQRDSR
jgi:hypothetical protein